MLVFAIISLYNTFTCVSKQRLVKPIEKKALEEATLLKHLTGALQISAVSNPVDSLSQGAFQQFHDYLELTFRNIYESPNIQRQKIGGKSLLYKWVGRNPKLRPLLILGQLDVNDPPLAQIPNWTFNPFLGKVTDGYVYGAGTMGGKSISIAFLEALEQQVAAGVLPERTLYFALAHDREADSSTAIPLLAETFRSNGLAFEAIIGLSSAIVPAMELAKPIAFIHCAERHRVHLTLEAADFAMLTGVVERLQQKTIPIARNGEATRQLLFNLLPELPFVKRWALCNWGWMGWMVENQLRSDLQIGVMLNSSCELLRLEQVGENMAVAELSWLLSPDYTLADLQMRFDSYLKGIKTNWMATVEGNPYIAPTEGYAYEALHTTIKQVMGDVYVMPGIVGQPTEMELFKGLSRYCYHFKPYTFDIVDFELLRSGIDHRIAIDDYMQAVRFYAQLLKNMVL